MLLSILARFDQRLTDQGRPNAFFIAVMLLENWVALDIGLAWQRS